MRSEPVDDLTISAYIDGELEAGECADLEHRLSDDAELRQRVVAFRGVDEALNQIFEPVMASEMPALRSPPTRETSRSRFRWQMRWRMGPGATGVAMAASLVCGFFLGGHFFSQPTVGVDTGLGGYEAALSNTLESELSGASVEWVDAAVGVRATIMPVRTWRSRSGVFCREYEAVKASLVEEVREVGVACREGGSWRRRSRGYEYHPRMTL